MENPGDTDMPSELSREALAYAFDRCLDELLHGSAQPEFDTSLDWVALKNPDADLFMARISLIANGYNWEVPIYNSPVVPDGDIVLTRKSVAEEAGILGTLASGVMQESGDGDDTP